MGGSGQIDSSDFQFKSSSWRTMLAQVWGDNLKVYILNVTKKTKA